MDNKKLITSLGLAFLLSNPAVADLYVTTQIPASQDNTLIDDPDGARSDGKGPYFRVGLTGGNLGGGIRRGLVHFDLEGVIPPEARIEDVSVHLYLARGEVEKVSVRLYRALQDWGEGASCSNGGRGAPAQTGDATWLHTFYDTSFWDEPGGDRSRPASAREFVGMPGSYSWSSTRMKRDVQLWVEQPAENFGWLLIGDERTPNSVVAFGSREAAQCDTTPTGFPGPLLEVTYSLPE
jgi:hypothetical protein